MSQSDTRLRVYWRPGCSSCVRVKEFLAAAGVNFESINVSATPAAMQTLRAMGISSVPVLVRGSEHVFAQELADVARFVGLAADFARLPAPALVDKWQIVLAAAQRHVVQLPPELLARRATPGRERSVRELGYHIFQVADAFLRAVTDGTEDLAALYNAPPPASVQAAEDVRRYGQRVAERVRDWWTAQSDRSCSTTVNTYYGAQPLHHLLERCVWHSAQHLRQLVAVLEGAGISADRPLTAEDYAGLPLPAELWE